MRNSMLKRVVGALLCTSSFVGIVFRLCFRRRKSRKAQTVPLIQCPFGVQTASVYRIPHRDHCGRHTEAIWHAGIFL